MRSLKWFEKFLVYGCFGWSIEIIFTSISAQFDGGGDITLKGHSYIWMPLVWGLGFLILEKISKVLSFYKIHLLIKAFVYMISCIIWEYLFGIIFMFALKKIPWDYSYSQWSVSGATRLDYAPFWYLCGLFIERFIGLINRIRLSNKE